MGKSYAYYDRIRIGTTLIGMPETLNRSGAAFVPGLDRARQAAEYMNPNFSLTVTLLAAFHDASWRQRDLQAHFRQLHEDVIAFTNQYGRGWLTWINDSEETAVTTNAETAGSSVQIETGQMAALNVQAGDYVLIIPPDSLSPLTLEPVSEVCLVTAADGNSFTVDTLEENKADGSTVYKVFIAYPDAVFVSNDLGTPVEQAADFYRFSTSWQFMVEGVPVKSANI